MGSGGVLGAMIVGTAIFGFGGRVWGLLLIAFSGDLLRLAYGAQYSGPSMALNGWTNSPVGSMFQSAII